MSDDPLVAPRGGLTGARAELARDLEVVAHRAWPPLHVTELAGWTLRASAGASRRGNSVWAHGDVPDLPAALATVTDFYRAAGLPPTFQQTPVSRPSGLAAVLDAADFDDTGPTDVCTAPLAGFARPVRAGPPTLRVLCASGPDETWLTVAGQVLATFDTQRDGTLAVLGTLRLPTVYVTAAVDGVPIAVGRGVADGRWLGIYSMATLPAARGQGAARQVVATLASWAAQRGATHAYLQVEEVSTVARRLYAELGFRPVYRYSYRRGPIPPAPPIPAAGSAGSARPARPARPAFSAQERNA
ncbi:GNAT family N-acetyltransferase [Candidatus Frankia nodulisporulans]|uniref:GNAT family N-acetyltransferase n=1 Tax=Candidatus Frankia nodulisporulans TaxID=2060052 RepID=UPI0013D4A474|nr:GNAT family N-acetyltransferase [Candidatus Frankia nodulisporulans]